MYGVVKSIKIAHSSKNNALHRYASITPQPMGSADPRPTVSALVRFLSQYSVGINFLNVRISLVQKYIYVRKKFFFYDGHKSR